MAVIALLVAPTLAMAWGPSISVYGNQGQEQVTEAGQFSVNAGGYVAAKQSGGNVQDQTIGLGHTSVSFSGGCDHCFTIRNYGSARGLTNAQSQGYVQSQSSVVFGHGLVLQHQSQAQAQGQESGFRIRSHGWRD
jgi:flagellar basal body rod protein FlgG